MSLQYNFSNLVFLLTSSASNWLDEQSNSIRFLFLLTSSASNWLPPQSSFTSAVQPLTFSSFNLLSEQSRDSSAVFWLKSSSVNSMCLFPKPLQFNTFNFAFLLRSSVVSGFLPQYKYVRFVFWLKSSDCNLLFEHCSSFSAVFLLRSSPVSSLSQQFSVSSAVKNPTPFKLLMPLLFASIFLTVAISALLSLSFLSVSNSFLT